MRTIIAIAALAIMAPAAAKAPPASPEEQLAKALKGLTPKGTPQECLSPTQLQQSDIIAPDTIVYHSSPGTAYVNHVPDGCPALQPNRAILIKSSTGQFCRGDIFSVFDPVSHMDYGSCTLGSFQGYGR
jgi:Family of unknown function (DUF6491)